jgi:hypothetical protein
MANWVRDFLETHPDLAARPVYKRAKHSIHHLRADGLIEANFTGKPCHYLDGGLWKPIDTALVLDARTNLYGAPGIPVKISPEGLVSIDGQTYSQKTASIGVFDALATSKAFSEVLKLPAPLVRDDTLIREDGIYRHELRLIEDGLRETLTLLEFPKDVTGKSRDLFVIETATTGISLADTADQKEFAAAGMQFSPARAWDAKGVEAPVKRIVKGGMVYTGIPLEWLATAVYPVVVDPDFAAGTADGFVEGTSTTWATARSTATSLDNTYLYLLISSANSYGTFYVRRGFLVFDTSAIGAGSTVTQANLNLTAVYDNSSTDQDIQIVKCDWSGTNPLSSANKDTAFDNALASALDDSIWRNSAGMSLNTPYTSGNLSTAWISKTGSTYYALRGSLDAASQPASPTFDVVGVGSQDNSTAGYRPVLTVLYSAAATEVVPRRALLGVGR